MTRVWDDIDDMDEVATLVEKLVGKDYEGRYNCPHPDFDTIAFWLVELMNEKGWE